ncbi:MAG: LON peptidase substrate-binding domain-containing protein, partial [Legionellaceae bacterium]
MSSENQLPETVESPQDVTSISNLPVLPLRDVVVYPNMVIPLFVGREKSVKALEAAMIQNKRIFLVAQRVSANDDPHADDLYLVGTISSL